MNELMEKISYSIHRSYRKTIAITITPEGEVLVKAPKRLPKAFIEGFVSSKADWIADALEKRKKLEEQKKSFRLESICFLGGEYPVRIGPAGSAVRFTGKYFQVPKGPKEEQMRQVTLWMKAQAKEIFSARVELYAKEMNVRPKAVKVSSAKTRWGSYSSKGNVNLNWKLLFAPGQAVDYVVVHELAHAIEMNHGPQFWRIVAQVMPDYEEMQDVLKDLQKRLEREGWE
ncbi:MAG: M48 family metallopeptidase [Clostridiales bacterium]|nr:M48 family metallopeptidase [Clostridiales bacterium]